MNQFQKVVQSLLNKRTQEFGRQQFFVRIFDKQGRMARRLTGMKQPLSDLAKDNEKNGAKSIQGQNINLSSRVPFHFQQ